MAPVKGLGHDLPGIRVDSLRDLNVELIRLTHVAERDLPGDFDALGRDTLLV
jgi:hypothetical protein